MRGGRTHRTGLCPSTPGKTLLSCSSSRRILEWGLPIHSPRGRSNKSRDWRSEVAAWRRVWVALVVVGAPSAAPLGCLQALTAAVHSEVGTEGTGRWPWWKKNLKGVLETEAADAAKMAVGWSHRPGTPRAALGLRWPMAGVGICHAFSGVQRTVGRKNKAQRRGRRSISLATNQWKGSKNPRFRLKLLNRLANKRP